MPVFKASGFFVPMRTTHIPVSPDWYTVILQTYANREHGEVLGPEGVGYVQVSPPQESIQGTQWWTSYQPVSYKLDSKEGTEAEFKNMVRQCKAAGVGVIADTVINHTTGVDKTQGTGTAGSPYDNKAISLKPDTRHRTSMPPVLSDVPRRRKRVELPGIGFAGP